MTSPPRVVILVATYNGASWLDDQFQSFTDQTDIKVSVVLSDDQSTDSTVSIAKSWADRVRLTVLPSVARMGNANRNFMRLIREAPVGESDYVCFSDQDDIWDADKLRRAVARLRQSGADAYSSNVTAFWDDGREKLIRKAQPQRSLDHLFESAGPGCTFVFARAPFLQLREWAIANADPLAAVRVHDWAIYAYARENGWRWIIDDYSGVRYRQHASNEIGANVGWRSALRRLSYLVSDRYRSDVIAIATLSGHQSQTLHRLVRLSVTDRLALMLNARSFRRRLFEALTLAVVIILMKRSRPVDA